MSSSPLRVVAISGWGRVPDSMYWPSLIPHLRAAGATVLPYPEPCADGDIAKHVTQFARFVGTPDERTYFIGQSVGNQVICRYLSSLPAGSRVGGWIAIAGWFNIDRNTVAPRPAWVTSFYESSWDKLAPWCDESTIDAAKVRACCPKVLALLGADDFIRGIDNGGQENKADFERLVHADVKLRANRGHYILEKLPEEEVTDIFAFLGLERPKVA